MLQIYKVYYRNRPEASGLALIEMASFCAVIARNEVIFFGPHKRYSAEQEIAPDTHMSKP